MKNTLKERIILLPFTVSLPTVITNLMQFTDYRQ